MLRRLARHSGGVILVEFALVLPVLVLMLLGSFVISDMIICNRKVTATTRALADLVSRSISPSSVPTAATVTTYLNSAELVMAPYSASNLTVQVSELRICDATHAWVVWSSAQTGTASATPNQTASTVVTIPSGLLDSASPMIPVSPDGSNVCTNTSGDSTTKYQVGLHGGYFYYAQVSYAYTPAVSYQSSHTTPMADAIYMIPRLN